MVSLLIATVISVASVEPSNISTREVVVVEKPVEEVEEDVLTNTTDSIKVEEEKEVIESVVSLSEYEKEILAVLVECEAGAESLDGKIAVAQVVLNRIESSEYPNDLIGVMYQPNQFQPVGDGVVDYKVASEESNQAVQLALGGYDVVSDSTMFWATYVPENHEVWNYGVRFQIGTHVFAGYIQ